MANEYGILSSLDDVLTASLADYSPTLTDNIYNRNVILSIANKNKKVVDGGNSVVYNVIKTLQDDGGFYTGADPLNTTQSQGTTQCEYRWQNAYEPIQITKDEERQNSGSTHKIFDLMAGKIRRSELAMSNRIEQALSTSVSGAGYINDLETIANTGTLGTIAGATDTFWQATVTTSGSFAAQGLTDMATAYYAVSSAENTDTPDLIITNKTIFQYFEQTRLPLERVENGNLKANAGFTNLTFKGVPVTYGNFIGTGLMFGINTNYLDYIVDSEMDFMTTEFMRPVNQMSKVAFILHRTCGFATDNRRRFFKLTSITA